MQESVGHSSAKSEKPVPFRNADTEEENAGVTHESQNSNLSAFISTDPAILFLLESGSRG